jgi:hypothetical protein
MGCKCLKREENTHLLEVDEQNRKKSMKNKYISHITNESDSIKRKFKD